MHSKNITEIFFSLKSFKNPKNSKHINIILMTLGPTAVL